MDSKGGSWRGAGGAPQPPWLFRRKANPSSSTTSEQASYRLLRLFSKVRASSFCCSSFPTAARFFGPAVGGALPGGYAAAPLEETQKPIWPSVLPDPAFIEPSFYYKTNVRFIKYHAPYGKSRLWGAVFFTNFRKGPVKGTALPPLLHGPPRGGPEPGRVRVPAVDRAGGCAAEEQLAGLNAHAGGNERQRPRRGQAPRRGRYFRKREIPCGGRAGCYRRTAPHSASSALRMDFTSSSASSPVRERSSARRVRLKATDFLSSPRFLPR